MAILRKIGDKVRVPTTVEFVIENKRLNEKLNKAKEIITALLCIPNDMAYEELNSGSWDIVYKAEQFLKEEENEIK